MQEHLFVTFAIGGMLNESRTTALDLHSAASLLLDELDIGATLANNLSPKVKARDWI